VPMYTINTPNFKLTSFPTPAPTEVIFVSAFDDFAAFEKHLNGPSFRLVQEIQQPFPDKQRGLLLFLSGSNANSVTSASKW